MKSTFKQVTFRIFNDQGHQDIRCRPDKDQLYNEQSINDLTHCVLKHVLNTFPGVSYKVVRVKPNRFNIIPHTLTVN